MSDEITIKAEPGEEPVPPSAPVGDTVVVTPPPPDNELWSKLTELAERVATIHNKIEESRDAHSQDIAILRKELEEWKLKNQAIQVEEPEVLNVTEQLTEPPAQATIESEVVEVPLSAGIQPSSESPRKSKRWRVF